MRQLVIDAFPAPAPVRSDREEALHDLETRYVSDAYHSLSIEGYRVTPDLIERIRRGSWDPDGADRQARDAIAAKGYFEAHAQVKDFAAQWLRQAAPRFEVRDALSAWYRALFSPSVQAGLLTRSHLAGWRNEPVYIRGALHVPLSKEAVRDCMPALFELLAAEPHAAVRAVLGHFFFVHIHPYLDGNGRLARFLMNAMLVTGGHVWTVIPVQQRERYMLALERASSFHDIEPLARFVSELTQQQALAPLPRPAG